MKTTSIIAGQEKRIASEKVKRLLAEQKAKRLEDEKRRREEAKPKLSRSQRAIKISNDIAQGLDTASRIASRTPIMQPSRNVKAYLQDNDDFSGYLG